MRPSVLRKFSAALSHNSASKRFRLNRPILAAIFFSVALVPLFYKPDLFPFGGDRPTSFYRVLAYGYDFRG
jgi:hypothetical protein